jgi:hypothetical protein
MKQVLIIARDFNHPKATTQRIRGLATFLPEFGWEPTILTNPIQFSLDPRFKVVETDSDDLLADWKKMLHLNPDKAFGAQFGRAKQTSKKTLADVLVRLWAELVAYPDIEKIWKPNAIAVGTHLLETENFDALISSSGPATTHLIAKDLKNRFKIPWIADFRDLWTQNHYYKGLWLREILERRLEVRTLADADAITTATHGFKEQLQELHTSQTIHAILNGFNPYEVNDRKPASDKFRITYTGSLYNGAVDPELLLQALDELNSEGAIELNDVEVHFFACNESWLGHEISRYNLDGIVEMHDAIERDAVIEKQRESQLLLLMLRNDRRDRRVIPAKIFEYLAARRPILSLGIDGGCVGDVLLQTNAGIQLTTLDQVKQEVAKDYKEFKSTGCVSYTGVPAEVDRYSQREMAKKFCSVLNDFV